MKDSKNDRKKKRTLVPSIENGSGATTSSSSYCYRKGILFSLQCFDAHFDDDQQTVQQNNRQFGHLNRAFHLAQMVFFRSE